MVLKTFILTHKKEIFDFKRNKIISKTVYFYFVPNFKYLAKITVLIGILACDRISSCWYRIFVIFIIISLI